MKLIVTIVIALVVAMGLALVSIEDPGYVVLARDPYVVRLPLLMFVLLVALAFAVLYLLFNFLVGMFRVPRRYDKWRSDSNERSAHKHTMAGYAGLIEGDWSRAEKSLLKKLDHNKTPLMNYLGAAYAAHQQGSLERRNQYLDDALQTHPNHRLAIDLTRARLLYKGGDLAEARDLLESLRKLAPKNIPVARLLSDVYRDLEDWNSSIELLPSLKRLKAFPEDELVNREKLLYSNMVASPALLQGEGGQSPASWESLPSAKRKDPLIVSSYARQLLKSGDTKGAEKVLRSALNRKFNDELIHIYGTINSEFLDYQIQLAESFKRKHAENPELKLALARLYRFKGENATAKQLFKECIEAGGRDEAYIDLASLLEELGEPEAALASIKKGMGAINPEVNLSALPRPREGELVLASEEIRKGA